MMVDASDVGLRVVVDKKGEVSLGNPELESAARPRNTHKTDI